MRLMLRSERSRMVHPPSCTLAAMEDIPMSQLGWARYPSTYATVVVQPLARGGNGFPGASTNMSSADGTCVLIRVLHLRSRTQGAFLVSSISNEGMVTTARVRSRAIFATMRCNERRGALMYSKSQRLLLQPRFQPFLSLVQTLGHFRRAVASPETERAQEREPQSPDQRCDRQP